MNDNLHMAHPDVAIIVPRNVPSILNKDYLYRKGIIKEEWNWAVVGEPISTQFLSHVVFDSGLSITAQADRVLLCQQAGEGIPEDAMPEGQIVASIALEYIKSLPTPDCTAVGVNPKAYLVLPSAAEASHFISRFFAKDAPLLVPGQSWTRGAFRLLFELGRTVFVLQVDQARVSFGRDIEKPCITFQGNFHTSLDDETSEERVRSFGRTLDCWQENQKTFESLVEKITSYGAGA